MSPGAAALWHTVGVIEVVVIAIVLVVLIPVGFLMSTSIAAGLIGFLLKDDAETRHADSELLETNR